MSRHRLTPYCRSWMPGSPGHPGGWCMYGASIRLGRGAARHHWSVIGAWLVIVVGLFVLRSSSAARTSTTTPCRAASPPPGSTILNSDFAKPGGYARLDRLPRRRRARSADQADAVKTAMAPSAGCRRRHAHRSAGDRDTRRTSPRTAPSSTRRSRSTSCRPPSTPTTSTSSTPRSKPARDAGLEVEYGGGAGQIGKQADDAALGGDRPRAGADPAVPDVRLDRRRRRCRWWPRSSASAAVWRSWVCSPP